MSKIVRVLPPLGIAAGALALLAAPAGAHISPDKDEVPAGSHDTVTLSVGHGCETSPTNQLVIEVPASLNSVTPQIHPGWKISVQNEDLATPVDDGEGGEITERMKSVTFTADAGNELPDGYRDTFTLGFTTPETEGEYLFFKTVQKCPDGETAWIEEYTGEGEEPEHPSPAVLIGPAAADEHGGAAEEEEPEAEAVVTEEASSSSDDSDDGGSDGLAIAGIVLGAAGLATGGFALTRSRKSAGSS